MNPVPLGIGLSSSDETATPTALQAIYPWAEGCKLWANAPSPALEGSKASIAPLLSVTAVGTSAVEHTPVPISPKLRLSGSPCSQIQAGGCGLSAALGSMAGHRLQALSSAESMTAQQLVMSSLNPQTSLLC